MSSHTRSFVFSRCTRPFVGISITSGNYLTKYRSQLYADSTKATYKTHLDTYLRFCLYMGYTPVQVQPDHLLQYTAFSARCLKAASARGYLNIIGIPHKRFGLLNPLLDKWPPKSLKSLLTGINRSKGQTKSQRHPISPSMFLQLHDQLNLESSFEASFWAIFLVAFYGMFRNSHLLPVSPTSFDPRKQLTKADFKIFPWGVLITIHWSKTIQFRGRVVIIPLSRIPHSPLCPTALLYGLGF